MDKKKSKDYIRFSCLSNVLLKTIMFLFKNILSSRSEYEYNTIQTEIICCNYTIKY